MPFNVNEFSSAINRRGLALNNLFVLKLTPPQGLESDIGMDELVFFCRSAQVPSVQFTIDGARKSGYGPLINYPVAADNDAITAEFMVDAGMNVKKFFHAWAQLIYNYNSEQGAMASSEAGQGVFEFGYKKEYCGTIEIDVYSTHDEQNKYTYKYFEVWPTVIGNAQYAWGNGADVLIMPITFRYSYFTNDGTTANVVDTGSGVNEVGFTSAFNSVGQLINNTGVPQFINDINNVQNAVNRFGSLLRGFF